MSDTKPTVINLLYPKEFQDQVVGTLLCHLPTELLSTIVQFRPSKDRTYLLVVGPVHQDYKQRFTCGGEKLLSCPWNILLLETGGFVVLGHKNNCLQFFSAEGVHLPEKKLLLPDNGPLGLWILKDGNYIISEFTSGKVRVLLPNGTQVKESGIRLQQAYHLAFDEASGKTYVANWGAHEVKILNSELEVIGALTHPDMRGPTGVTLDQNGTVYVVQNTVQGKPSRLWVFDSRGEYLRSWDATIGCFSCTLDCFGNILFPSISSKTIYLFSPTGEQLKSWDLSAENIAPIFVAIDPKGDLYISDYYRDSVVVWTQDKK